MPFVTDELFVILVIDENFFSVSCVYDLQVSTTQSNRVAHIPN